LKGVQKNAFFLGGIGKMYKRVLLKLSGETLSGEGEKGFNSEMLKFLLKQTKKIIEKKIALGIVVGAGNIFRGKELIELSITLADQIGMLGTVINALYLKEFFENNSLNSAVFSQIVTLPSVKQINYFDIEQCFSNGFAVFFAGGTSNPLFTTDTAAALRAVEMKANILIKATKVDGIYSSDPRTEITAKKYERISFSEAIDKNLKIMDTEAFSICRRFRIPIRVIDFFKEDNLLKSILEEPVGTLVYPD